MPPSNKKNNKKSKTNRNGPRADSLDKVREILLGEERRSRVETTSRIERDLAKQMKAIRAQTQESLDETQERLSDKIDALHDALLEDQASRRKSHAALSKRVTKLVETVDQKFSAIRKRITKSAGDLRGQLNSECGELRAEFDVELAELRRAKTDRTTLSGLLSDLAKKVEKKS